MSSRSTQIAEAVTRAILARRLWPGHKLGERELGEVFEVSRPVVRQALMRLADQGLVETHLNRGAFVARPSHREAMEIYDALTLIEQGVVALLHHRHGAAAGEELRAHVALQGEAVREADHARADALGQEFHSLLVAQTRNRVLAETHAGLQRRATLLRSLYPSDFNYDALLDEHARIVELLCAGRVGELQALIAEHNRSVVLAYALDEPPPARPPLAEVFAGPDYADAANSNRRRGAMQ